MGLVTINNVTIDDEKYIVFKREEFEELLKSRGGMNHATFLQLLDELHRLVLSDAVVIRRQDKFASPCLLTYAAMMSMVADNCTDLLLQDELRAIADYFQRQGELAGEEGYKLPTI